MSVQGTNRFWALIMPPHERAVTDSGTVLSTKDKGHCGMKRLKVTDFEM
jgi:hypothetical protein